MLFQELGKLKQSTIMTSIIAMAAGIIMLICPASYDNALIVAVGYVLLVGAVVLILGFIAGKKDLADYISLTAALILLILGVAVMVFTNNILPVISLIFGLFLILDGLHSMFHAFMYARRAGRKGWWVLVILSAMLIVCGLVILVHPGMNTPHALLQVVGGTMLFSAAVGILRLIWVWPLRSE